MSEPGTSSARDRSFHRKIIYLVVIGLLLMPLFLLSQPATRGTKEQPGQAGGVLSRLREENRLSQTELGQIDPTSETIRLATLGMRGIATTLLWAKAHNYQMKKDWTNLRATLEQISKLQPHSTTVWGYQAWNLSYNVSVSFDDYHERYYWIIEGIKFLEHGVDLNEFEPKLAWDTGWFFSNKIGKADEATLYRELFRKDAQKANNDEFQKVLRPADGVPPGLDLTDNWLVGKAWMLSAEKKINKRHPVRGMADVVFYSDAPLCQFYYADALEKEGRFGEVAKYAWIQAGVDWRDGLGAHVFPGSDETTIRLNDQEKYEEQIWEDGEAIEKLSPGVWKELRQKRLAKLAPDELKAWHDYVATVAQNAWREVLAERMDAAKPTGPRTWQNYAAVLSGPALWKEAVGAWQAATLRIEKTLRLGIEEDEGVRITEIDAARASRTTGPKRAEAMRLAADAERLRKAIADVRVERSKVNFVYWRLRARMEQTDRALQTRRAIYEADQALRQHGDLVTARRLYEQGLQGWRWLLDRYPALKEDSVTGRDIMDIIRRYLKCLDQEEQRHLPKPFILQDILDKYEKQP